MGLTRNHSGRAEPRPVLESALVIIPVL